MKKELTTAQREELKALQEMPDKEIDYSDIPPVTDWSGAVNRAVLQARQGNCHHPPGCGRARLAETRWEGVPDQGEQDSPGGHGAATEEGGMREL